MPVKRKRMWAPTNGRRADRTLAEHRDEPVEPVYVLKITLLHSKPVIWRRVAAPAGNTLGDLHAVIQLAFGWYDCHLHQFTTRDGTQYGSVESEPLPDWDADIIEEGSVKLSSVLAEPRQRIVYEYDFGDGWEHGIELEKIIAPEPGVAYPSCLAGARACPPEDCGGLPGYSQMLKALANPKHPEHAELKRWIGGKFDAASFSVDKANANLKRLRQGSGRRAPW